MMRRETPAGAPSRNGNLHSAKRAKNDEFYTQWVDIEREMNAYIEYDPDVFRGKTVLLPCDDPDWSNFTKFFARHFTDFGIEKLISTSYAPASKPAESVTVPSGLEARSPRFDPELPRRGKVLTLTPEDVAEDGHLDLDSLRLEYLEGDGDFRSEEVTALRDEADMVITNPPFSLFREFLAWLVEGGVQFSIIGNQNALTYKEVFPLIQQDRVWWGRDCVRWFSQPDGSLAEGARSRWFTNIEHGRRHEPLQLMTMADNQRFSKHKQIRDVGYPEYVNFDAIEVARVDAIPSDYEGLMGVPITFLDKHNPDQFEIVGYSGFLARPMSDYAPEGSYPKGGLMFYLPNGDGTYRRLFDRIVIRHRKPQPKADYATGWAA